MKSISLILSLLLPLTLSITLITATATATVPPLGTSPTNLIPKACGNSTNKAMCVAVFTSEPTAQNADLKNLAFISLKAAADTAANTSMHIRSMLIKGFEDQPALDDGLTSCSESYLDVVDQIEDSMDALIQKNVRNVNTWMKAAIADVITCDMSLQGQTAPAAKELIEKSRVVKEMCRNALEVVRVFNHNRGF